MLFFFSGFNFKKIFFRQTLKVFVFQIVKIKQGNKM